VSRPPLDGGGRAVRFIANSHGFDILFHALETRTFGINSSRPRPVSNRISMTTLDADSGNKDGPTGSAPMNDAQHPSKPPVHVLASSVAAIWGAAISLIAIQHDHGIPKAAFWASIIAFAICVFSTSQLALWSWIIGLPLVGSWIKSLFEQSLKSLIGTTIVCVIVTGSVLAYYEISPSLFRTEFTASNDRLALEDYGYANMGFAEPLSNALVDRVAEEKQHYDTWIRWMYGGTDRPPIPASDPTKAGEPGHALLYLKSVPFPNDYLTFDGDITVADHFEIVDGIAYSVLEDPDSRSISHRVLSRRWYKPELRSMKLEIEKKNKRTATVTVKRPNEGEQVLIFLHVTYKNADRMPKKDTILVTPEIELDP
jgi:hypothetical protein